MTYKKPAISVIGAPAAGKDTLLLPYEEHVMGLGAFTHGLPDHHPLKKECKRFWAEGRMFEKDLVERLLQECPVPNTPWIAFNGGPRHEVQVDLYNEVFDMKAYIMVSVDDAVWEKRARKVVEERAGKREDSSLEQLRKRKEEFEETKYDLIEKLEPFYTVDNSGPIETTREVFEDLLTRVTGRR